MKAYLPYLVVVFIVPLLGFLLEYQFQVTYVVNDRGLVFITGASTGIGRYSAEALSKGTGYTLLVGVRKQVDADEISSLNIPSLSPIIVDVSSHESCIRAVQTIEQFMEEKKLTLSAVVHNAGISRHIPLELHNLDDFESVFKTNVFGVVDLTQMLLPSLRKGAYIPVYSLYNY
jgi:3-oxoacyl-[acyl-carrier protein] reductase